MADIEKDMDPNDQVPDNTAQIPYAPQDAAPISTAPDAAPAIADIAAVPDGTNANTVASNDDANQQQQAPNGDDTATATAAAQSSSTIPSQQMAQGNPVLTPAEDAVQRELQSINLSKDFGSGAIKPETYHDLFAKKDTLGKIGSLFGLLLAGAGSGLAHQSNSVLDMWNNEINRDVDSQKSNSKAKQSFYTLAMQQENNIANNQAINANTAATRLGNEGKAIANDRAAWTNRNIPGLNDLSATVQARNATLLSSLQSKQNDINNMADGPMKQYAQTQLDTVVRPFAMQQITKNNMELGQKKSLVHAIDPDPAHKLQAPADPNGPAVNDKLLDQKRIIGLADPANPMGIPPALMPEIITEKTAVQKNRANYANWADMYRDLQNTKNAGQVPLVSSLTGTLGGAGAGIGTVLAGPIGTGIGGALGATFGQGANALGQLYERKRGAYVNTLKHQLGANYSSSDKDKQIEAILPNWIDKPNDPTYWNNAVKHFENLESGMNGGLKTYGVHTNFPKLPFEVPKSSKSVQNNANQPQQPDVSEAPTSIDYP